MSVTQMFSRFEAQADEQVEAGERRGARARATSFTSPMSLPTSFSPLRMRRARDDRGAVLVVVEHRDLHALAQLRLDVEALGRLDVLEVDAAEGRLQRAMVSISLSGSCSSSSMSKTSMPANFLNRQPLPSITGLPASGADVAQAQHRGAVGDRPRRGCRARSGCRPRAGRRRSPGRPRRRPASRPAPRSRCVAMALVGVTEILPGVG